MINTLVIILGETRAHELTFDNFKKNVMDVLNADLCVCIGVKPDYDYSNPFYQLAKYRFLYEEPNDYGGAFDEAFNIINKQRKSKYEKLENLNSLGGNIEKGKSNENVTYHGLNEQNELDLSLYDDDDEEVVLYTNNFHDKDWRNSVYGIKKSFGTMQHQENVITYRKPLHWREFFKLRDNLLGGIKDARYQHNGSGGIQIFFRWFLLQNLIEKKLIDKYDRFVITRSDFLYQLPHPKIESMSEKYIWVPDGEQYGGITDRHVVLTKETIEPYLNILNNLVLRSNVYFSEMQKLNVEIWNIEQLIKFHLVQSNLIYAVKEFPYIMYSVRAINGTTRWSQGVYNEQLGYCIKYSTEYEKATHFKKFYESSEISLDDALKSLN